MALIQSLIQFFGIDLLTTQATFTDLLNVVIQIGMGMWITMFVCKCLFMATNVADRRFY